MFLLKGFLGFSRGSFFIFDTGKTSHLNIPRYKISRVVFKAGPAAGNFPWYAYMMGLPGLLFGGYDGAGSLLEIKSAFGLMRFYLRFDNKTQKYHFINTIKTHPATLLLKK